MCPDHTRSRPGKALTIPIAHGEGRYFATPDVMQEILSHDQVLYYYSDAHGQVTAEQQPQWRTA